MVFLYLLNWSDKYPLISSNLLFFLLATSLLSLIFSVKTHKNRDFEYKALVNPLNYYKWVMKQTRRVYFLLCIEFIYFQTIPLIAYLRGNADHRLYMDFAMPIVHILVLNGVLFCFTFLRIVIFHKVVGRTALSNPC